MFHLFLFHKNQRNSILILVYFSDRRVKTDIQTYSKGLNQIMEINPVTFKYNKNSGYSNTSKDYVGIISQEIEQVLSSMVDQIDDS